MINVLLTADRISSSTNAALKPFALSKEQYNVLRILRGQYPTATTLQLISDRMISKASNATRLVEKLRQKRYVERGVCESNRRQVDILITKKGLEVLKELDPLVRRSHNRVRHLSEKEAKELNRLLDKMRS